MMKFTVKILGGQECSIEMPATTLIEDVKKELSVKMDVPVDRQKLVFKGKTLVNTSAIADYSLEEGAKVHLLVSKPATASSASTSTAPSTSTSPSSSTTSSKSGSSPDFWHLLSELLRRHFAAEDVDKIIAEYKREFEVGLQSLNLDDIDRLAHAILEGQQQSAGKVTTAEPVPS